MKYLVVILVIAVVGWIMLRGGSRKPPPKRRARPAAGPQTMAVCDHCGVHLPRADAVVAANGVYCSDAHRIAGPRHP